jgi:two-component system nitrate/nitrite response regulator NarL
MSDQPVLLRGFERVLFDGGFSVTTGQEPGPGADLILLDAGVDLTLTRIRELHRRAPQCPMVLWTDPLPQDLVFKTLECGVRGTVPRSSKPEQLLESLRRVAAGELQIGFGTGQSARRAVSLTPREREIIEHLRRGIRNKQIADEMGITEGTVKIYLFRLFQKMGVKTRFELARCGLPA